MNLKDIHLVLFLTEGTRLSDWHQTGLLSREAELYNQLRPQLGSIAWVTYGGQADLAYQDVLPNIQILTNRWRLPNQVYIQQLPWLYGEIFAQATILKSEQTGAAQAALRVAEFFGKRYLARSGFSLALFAQYAPQEYETNYETILALEKRSFQVAQQIVVTTEEMRQTALKTHTLSAEKIRVIPNYVNTERFRPVEAPVTTDKPRIIFAGRLTPQKNVDALLTALAPLTHIQADLIGNGELRGQLAERIERENLSHIRLVGNIPNADLPRYLQQATIYVQPSLYEGHPKTIFEAMACGLPVLVSDVAGIRQFIHHGENGWLCGTDSASIRAGLETLLADAPMRQTLAQNARQYVVNEFALSQIVAQELAVLEAVSQQPAPPPRPEARPILKSIFTYGQRVVKLARQKFI